MADYVRLVGGGGESPQHSRATLHTPGMGQSSYDSSDDEQVAPQQQLAAKRAWMPNFRTSLTGVRAPLPPPSGYLTLIPLSDERLKPRRTTLLVFTSAVLMACACSAVFFLVTRGVAVGNITVYSSHMSFNTSKSTYQIVLAATLPLYNYNWLPVQLSGTVNVSFYDQQAGSTTLEPLTIPARTSPMNYTMEMDASSVPQKYLFTIYTQCFTFPEQLIFFLNGKLRFRYLGLFYDIPEFDQHFIVSCSAPADPPKPPKPVKHTPPPPPAPLQWLAEQQGGDDTDVFL